MLKIEYLALEGTEGSTVQFAVVLFDGLENSTEFTISISIQLPDSIASHMLVSESVTSVNNIY